MSAKEARLYQKLANRLVECEERSKLLRRMIKEEIGFNEEEQFITHERGKLKGKNEMKKERREFLALIMGKKLKDNIHFERDLRFRRDQSRRKLEDAMGPNSTACRRMVKRSKFEGEKLRMSCRTKNMRKFDHLKAKYGMRASGLDELCEEDQAKYED